MGLKLIRCNSCGGTYPDTSQEPCVQYFHVCPDTMIDQHAVCDPKTGDTITPATFKKLDNPRNENLRFNPETQKHEMISEGLGVTRVD